MTQPLWIASLGALVGLVLALTGAGGGAIAVPLLMFGAGLSVQQAAPVSLAAVGLAAVLGALLGLREGVVRYRAALVIGAAGMAMAPLGVMLAQRLPATPVLSAFAAFMLFTSWRMLRTAAATMPGTLSPACQRAPGARQLSWTPRCAAVLASVGGVSGLMSGLLGIGGGFVIVPALERRTNLDFASIQATSLTVIALVAASGFAAAAWRGSIAPFTAAPFAAGAVAGLLAGRHLARRLPLRQLRRAFALVAGGTALWIIARAWEIA